MDVVVRLVSDAGKPPVHTFESIPVGKCFFWYKHSVSSNPDALKIKVGPNRYFCVGASSYDEFAELDRAVFPVEAEVVITREL